MPCLAVSGAYRDLSGLPPRVVEAAARVRTVSRSEEVELRVREATNEFVVMGAVIENRVPDQSWFHVRVTPNDQPRSVSSALPQRRERGTCRRWASRRLPDAAGGRARSADDGSLHGPGSRRSLRRPATSRR